MNNEINGVPSETWKSIERIKIEKHQIDLKNGLIKVAVESTGPASVYVRRTDTNVDNDWYADFSSEDEARRYVSIMIKALS